LDLSATSFRKIAVSMASAGEEEHLSEVTLLILEPEVQQLPGDAGGVGVVALPPCLHLTAENIDDMVAMGGRQHLVEFHEVTLPALGAGIVCTTPLKSRRPLTMSS